MPDTKNAFAAMVLFFTAFLAPVPCALAAAFLVSAPDLNICYATKVEGQTDERFPEVFHELNRQLRESTNDDERDAIYRGRVVYDGSPVLVSMHTNMLHQALIGSPGSRKTSYMLMLIEAYLQRGDTSVIVFDHKSDTYELLQTLLAIAPTVRERTRMPVPVWRFTNREGDSSHLFSLMDQDFWSKLSNLQRTDVEQTAMGISSDRSYGPSWFSDVSLANFLYMQNKYPNVRSFSEQAERLRFELSQRGPSSIPEAIRRDGMHSSLILDRLGLCDSINPRAHYSQEILDSAIDMSRFFKEPCCLYAGLSAMLAPITAPEIARVMLSALFMAGMTLSPTERKMNVVIFFDEIQAAISATAILERALQQARSVGASFVLSNQTVADYVQGDSDVTSTMYGCTAIQQWFAVRDPLGIAQLIQLGGKTVENVVSESFGQGAKGESYTRSYQQQVVNRLEANEILKASSIPDQFFIRICTNEGLAHYDSLPFVGSCPFHITREEYRRRQNAPWPSPTPDTLIVGQHTEEPGKQTGPSTTPKPPTSPVISSGSLGEVLRPRKGTSK